MKDTRGYSIQFFKFVLVLYRSIKSNIVVIVIRKRLSFRLVKIASVSFEILSLICSIIDNTYLNNSKAHDYNSCAKKTRRHLDLESTKNKHL